MTVQIPKLYRKTHTHDHHTFVPVLCVRLASKCSFPVIEMYVPPMGITLFPLFVLRLPRRWCLTSVDYHTSVRFNRVLKKNQKKDKKTMREDILPRVLQGNRVVSWRERILIGASESYDLCSMCSIGGTGSLRSHSTWDPRRHMYEELSHYAPNRRCPPPPRMGSADGLSHRGW